MDTIEYLGLSMERFKCLSEDLLGRHPLQNRLPTDVKVRRGRWISGDAVRVGKMCFIMTATTCYSEGYRQTSTTSSSASDPLLIIEALGGHITHHHGQEGANVYSCLHCRGDTEQVNGVDAGNFWRNAEVLKQALPLYSIIIIGLPRQLLAMEAERVVIWR